MDEFNVRLAHAVKKYPIIYNSSIKGFQQKRCVLAREKAWKAIGEKLNCDVIKLKSKWQSIRSNLHRIQRQKQSGKNVPEYYLHDHIKYVIPFLKNSHNTTNNEEAGDEEEAKEEQETEEEKEEEEAEEEKEELEEEKLDLEYENESVEDYEIVDEIDDTDQDTMSFKNNDYSLEEGIMSDELTEKASSPLPSPKRYSSVVKKRDVITSTQSTPLWNATQIASSSIGNAGLDESINGENAKRHFLFSLLPDLDEMTNSQMRYFKCQVLNLIHEILKEN